MKFEFFCINIDLFVYHSVKIDKIFTIYKELMPFYNDERIFYLCLIDFELFAFKVKTKQNFIFTYRHFTKNVIYS